MLVKVACLMCFLISLPWVWISFFPSLHITIRPAIVGGFPILLYYVLKDRSGHKKLQSPVIFLIVFVAIVWFSPTFYHENPHWSLEKVASVFIYSALAFSAARVYLTVSLEKNWEKYWPIVGVSLVISCVLSFYFAFGTLVPNTSLASSEDFIHGFLNASMFDPTQSGKGIRHTMAIVCVVTFALIVHNRKHLQLLNIALSIAVVYLAFFSFSRSAWLATILVMIMNAKLMLRDLRRNYIVAVFAGGGALATLVILVMFFPEKLGWASHMFVDRVSDEASTDGRLWVVGHMFTDTSFLEWITGYNRVFQQSPHDLILDSTTQSGLLGTIVACVIVVYTSKMYITGLRKSEPTHILTAAFAAPALIRMFTAGSGLLHIAELFGLFVAVGMSHQKMTGNEMVLTTSQTNINRVRDGLLRARNRTLLQPRCATSVGLIESSNDKLVRRRKSHG